MEQIRKDADAIVSAGIKAVLPDEAVRRALKDMPETKGNLILVAAGKAAWQMAILVNGKACKCAVAHNLGQVRKLLEGGYKNYDVVRLMA